MIAQGCSGGGGTVARGASKFVATGRGGLPPTPTEALRSDSVLADLGTLIEILLVLPLPPRLIPS